MNLPNVSIAIPYYNGNHTITQVIKALKEQDYPAEVEILIIDDKSPDPEAEKCVQNIPGVKIIRNEVNLGLAKSMNKGIENASHEHVVTLHHDAQPSAKNWLKNLIIPFEDPNVIASVSRNHLAKDVWETWGYWHKALTANEVKSFHPSLDGRSTAFKKEVVKQFGFFDGDTFRTSGEDVDLFFKMKGKGKIAHPDAEVIHLQGAHRSTFYKQLRREFQYGEGNGANIRRHKLKIFHSSMRILVETISLAASPLYFTFPRIGSLGLFIFLIMSNMTILPYQLKNLGPDLRNLTLPFANFLARGVYILGALFGFIAGKQKIV